MNPFMGADPGNHLTRYFIFVISNLIVFPAGKMAVFGATFEVNSIIGTLRDLLGHFDKKDTLGFITYLFLLNDSIILCAYTAIV